MIANSIALKRTSPWLDTVPESDFPRLDRPLSVDVAVLGGGMVGISTALLLKRAGMTVAWQSEIDPYASRVLAKHWPHVPNLGDITTIAQNWQERLDGFNVYRKGPGAPEYTSEAWVMSDRLGHFLLGGKWQPDAARVYRRTVLFAEVNIWDA